jgi:transcriptional regulator with XRE-family HTH domain
MTFQEKLRRLLEDHNRAAFARRVGISATTLNNYALRGTQPLAKKALKIARTLHVEFDWLIDDSRDWPPKWVNKSEPSEMTEAAAA